MRANCFVLNEPPYGLPSHDSGISSGNVPWRCYFCKLYCRASSLLFEAAKNSIVFPILISLGTACLFRHRLHSPREVGIVDRADEIARIGFLIEGVRLIRALEALRCFEIARHGLLGQRAFGSRGFCQYFQEALATL